MHHDSVTKLEDLEREDCAGEENEWEREERKLDDVIGFRRVRVVMLLGERRRRTSKRAEVVISPAITTP